MPKNFTEGHALIVGVGADLPRTINDAKGLANILKDKGRCAYPPEQVHLLTSEQANRKSVLTALDKLAQSTDSDSTVIIYFSGHGYTTGQSYYLMTYGYDVNRLDKTTISGTEFAGKLKAIQAKKVVVLLDCCHAGGVSKKDVGLTKSPIPIPHDALEELEKGRGYAFIASSRENEFSYLYHGDKYSLFTQALIEVLQGQTKNEEGYVRILDLAGYTCEVVPKRTKNEDKQHPIFDFKQSDNFAIAYYTQSETPSEALRVALLYKRRAQPDEQLLGLLEEHLIKAGHSVFIDRHTKISNEWEKQMTSELKKADAVVILLSPSAVYSEMLIYEVELAYQIAQENAGKPRLFPIRLNFEEPLPQNLSNLLGNFPDTQWHNSNDDIPLVNNLLKQLIKSPTMPTKKYELEMVGGAIPLDSKFYVERQVDKDFQTAIARRDSIVLLKGARQVGKTSLLARGLQAAREAGVQVLLTDFQMLIDAQLQSLETFFIAIGEMLADQLDLDVYPQDKWRPHRAPNMNFDHYFRREILAKTQKPLLWAIDEADRLFLYNFSSEVFALCRTWHNERALNPDSPCSRLTLAIAYATETYLFIKDQNQSPFNVGTKLMLEDFTLEQVADLNQRYGSPLRDETELRHFNQLVGGQPYLVRCGLNDIVLHNKTLDEFISTADHDDKAFGDHLRRIVMLLNREPPLSDVMRGVLRGEACPDYDSFYRLRSAGILSGDSKNDVHPRCEIYATYLKKHLL